MNLDYTSVLIILLVFTQWTHCFSLHPLLYSSEDKFVDHQYVKSRWPSAERLRRWSQSADLDEIEIPINDVLPTTTSDATENMTLPDFQTTESNTTMMDIVSDENTTIVYPLLRQDFFEINQTNISMIEDVLSKNQTEVNENHFSSTMSDVNYETNETNFQSSSSTINYVQSTSTIEDYPTTMLDLSGNDTLTNTTTTNNEEWFNHSNISLKDAIIISQDVLINETEIIVSSTEIPIGLSTSTTIPICDQSCQCAKECPYGFEIANDTCQCDPPCKNYQCFNNDSCIVTDKGEPQCQPQNGTEHERPTRCYQPRDAGYHDTNLRYYSRWYYNPDQDTCHLFVYRGLGGNENNFPTLHQCHLECITCAPLPDPGECLGHINMWYFDRKANRCQQFEYSGCKGNENKFVKEEECVDTCINRILYL